MATPSYNDGEKKIMTRELIVTEFNEQLKKDKNLKKQQIFSLPGRQCHCVNLFKDSINTDARFIGLERFKRVYENMSCVDRNIFFTHNQSTSPKQYGDLYYSMFLNTFIDQIDPIKNGYSFDLSFLDLISEPKDSLFNQISSFAEKYCSNTAVIACCFLLTSGRSGRRKKYVVSDHDEKLMDKFGEHYYSVEPLLNDVKQKRYRNKNSSPYMYFNIFKLSGKK